MVKKYGYHPKAISLEGLPAEERLALRNSPRNRIFRVFFGRHAGELRAGDNVPWAGATIGAKTTEEAIERIKAINPEVAAGITKAMGLAKAKAGVTGVVRARYVKDGVVVTVPRAAAELAETAGTMEIVGIA